MKVRYFIPVWSWTSSPTPPLQGSLWFNNVGELRQELDPPHTPCPRCFQWKQERWARISELSVGYLYNFQCEKKVFCSQWPHAQRNESKKKVETGYFMFRLYLLKYLFVGGWMGYRNNWHLNAKNLKKVKGAEFQGEESEMCGLTSGCKRYFELHPLPTPRKCV